SIQSATRGLDCGSVEFGRVHAQCGSIALRPGRSCHFPRSRDGRHCGNRRGTGSPPRSESSSAGNDFMTNLSDWALKDRSFVIYLMIASVIAGLVSYYRLGRNEDPAFIIKTMIVQAAWPGATMDDTLKQVTERLERTLQETPNLDFVRSFTRPGITTIF